MAGWLQILAIPLWVPAACLRRLEARVVERMTAAGANTAERAVLLEDSGDLGDWVYRRLERAGVLIPAGNDRYYFCAPAYVMFRARRRRRAWLTILAAVLLAGALLLLRGDL